MNFKIYGRTFETYERPAGGLALVALGIEGGQLGVGALAAASRELLWFEPHATANLLVRLGPDRIVSLGTEGTTEKYQGPLSIVVVSAASGRAERRFTVPANLDNVYQREGDPHELFIILADHDFLVIDLDAGTSRRTAEPPQGRFLDVEAKRPDAFRLSQLADAEFEGLSALPAPLLALVAPAEALVRAVDLDDTRAGYGRFYLETTARRLVGELDATRTRVAWHRAVDDGVPLDRKKAWSRKSFFARDGGRAVFELSGDHQPLVICTDGDGGIKWELRPARAVLEHARLVGDRYLRLCYARPGALEIQEIDVRTGTIPA